MNQADSPFKFVSTRQIYKNPWITVREDAVIRPGGKDGIFGVITFNDSITVLPIDSNNNLVLAREYKYGVGRYVVETVSGAVDDDETPLQAAKRELAEEVGLCAKDWISLGIINPVTTVVEAVNHIFIARELDDCPTNPDEGEIIEKLTVAYAEARRMVIEGEITHATSCLLILRAGDYLG